MLVNLQINIIWGIWQRWQSNIVLQANDYLSLLEARLMVSWLLPSVRQVLDYRPNPDKGHQCDAWARNEGTGNYILFANRSHNNHKWKQIYINMHCMGRGVDNFFDVGGLTSLHASVHKHLLMILPVHIQCIIPRDNLFRGILKLQQNSVCYCYPMYTTLSVLSEIWGGGGFSPLSPHLSTPLPWSKCYSAI